MPNLIVIAGPNGSGKSTVAPALLQGAVQIDDFVNADVIAQGLSAFSPEKAAIAAGRIMLDRMHDLAEDKKDFAFETTLASRTFAPWIKQLKTQGYLFHLIFLWLNSSDLAVSRVQMRVKMGGHSIPEETIRRRYEMGIKNFFDLYVPICDSWKLYDNSNSKNIREVASEVEKRFTIECENTWKEISEIKNARK